MLGDRVKALRERKAWSQGHLADAAGLNVRTIQRIEAGDPCSHETLLSLASALAVDVSQLEPHGRQRSGHPPLTPTRAALAVLAMLPCALFVAVNLLRSATGVTGPYKMLAAFGQRFIRFQTFNAVSPFIFLGGVAIAVAVCLSTILAVRAKVDGDTIHLSGVRLCMRRGPLVLAAAALASAGVLLTYVALEQYRTLVP